MEEITIDKDITVFGFEVKTFPLGIDEAFKSLIERTGDATGTRDYYGISYFKDGLLHYIAAAAQKKQNEAAKFNYETFNIQPGKYIGALLTGWQTNFSKIKDVCMLVVNDERSDKRMPCIEWYKNSNELLCMIKAK